MKTLLIINDNSPESKHAAEFALAVAQKAGANIIVANYIIKAGKNKEKILLRTIEKDEADDYNDPPLLAHLMSLNNAVVLSRPEIDELNIADMDEAKLAELINLNHTWMMVKGLADIAPVASSTCQLNIQTVLNKVLCPLLLVPAGWQLKDVDRLVYIADLRYCRLHIVQYLAELARPWNASISIAHLSARGLPDMVEKYALSVFSEEVCPNVNYDQIFFNNIREKDLAKAVDILINGMHNDILVMVNHRFHFNEIIGRYIPSTLPLHINVPLLIFPY